MFRKLVIQEMANKLSLEDLTEYIEIIPIEDQSSDLIEFINDIIKEKNEKENKKLE